MSSTTAPPTFRSACENCHRRKMRCIMSPDNPACHNCSASGTQCLFAPRAKAGRPRRSESTQANSRSPKSIPQPSSHSSSSSSAPTQASLSSAPSPDAQQRSQSEQWHKRKGSPNQHLEQQQYPRQRTQSEPMNVWKAANDQQQQQQPAPASWIPGMDQTQFMKHQPLPETVEEETSMAVDPSCMLSEEDMSSFINMASFDPNGWMPTDPFMMQVLGNEPDASDLNSLQMQTMPMMPMLSSQGSGFETMPTMGPDMDLAMNMGILTPPSSSAASTSSIDSPPNGTLTFNELLKLCETLEQRCQMFRDPNYDVQDVPNVFNMIESVCRIAVEANPASLDQAGASAALIMATLHKYNELCWAIVKHFSGKTNQAQEGEALNHLLLLKRLDITLLQAKHAFARMSQPAGGKKALQVHQYIENIVKQQYQSWMW